MQPASSRTGIFHFMPYLTHIEIMYPLPRDSLIVPPAMSYGRGKVLCEFFFFFFFFDTRVQVNPMGRALKA